MNTILFVGEHPKTYDVRWHSHPHWELVYCTGGEGTFRFENGATMKYRTGDLVVIPPNEVHSNSSNAGFTNIHLTMEDPSFPYRTVFRVSDGEEKSLYTTFQEARSFYMTDIVKRELVLSALGDLIAAFIVVYRSNAEFSEPVERIRVSIVQNYTRPDFALDEVIRQMPFHYDYLRKLFKKEMGMSPLEYMTDLRMKAAEKMLSAMWNNEYSISEIARMCGYEDSLYFSRVFKKHFGCAPSTFARHRANADALRLGAE